MAEPAPASNAAWFARARHVIPGGVDSPVRSFASVGGTPYTVVSGDGAFVVDAEGKRYLDMVQSYGAVLLGHAHPVVTGAVTGAALRGTTFGAPTPGEVLLAEAICARVPGCEQVRLVSSGTEAAMSAVRLARGATGRDRVDQIRRLLPRPLRRPAGRRGKRRGHARSARLGRRVRRCGRGHRGRPLQRGPRARRARGVRDRRARGRQHEPRGAAARLSRRAAPGLRRQRCPPRLRRGHHRLPARDGGRHGLVRRDARPLVFRQGDRRRAAGRCLRRPARAHGRAGAGRPRLSSGHVVGKPARHCGGAGGARRGAAGRL